MKIENVGPYIVFVSSVIGAVIASALGHQGLGESIIIFGLIAFFVSLAK